MNNFFTVCTYSMMMRFFLIFVLSFFSAEVYLFNEFFFGEQVEISVDCDKVNVRDSRMYARCRKRAVTFFKHGQNFLPLFS